MKVMMFALLCAGCGWIPLMAQSPRVTRVGSEWSVTADFDNDGHADILHVQAEEGTYQILYGGAGGETLSPQRLLGTTDVGGLSVGKFRSLTHDRLLIASPSLNRIQWFDDGSRSGGSLLYTQQLDGIGPSQVVSLPLIESSASDEADLVVFSEFNNFGPQIERLDGSDGAALHLPLASEILRDGQAVDFENDRDPLAVFVRITNDGDESLWAGNANKAQMNTLYSQPLAGSGNQFTAAVFSPSAVTRFLVWQEGGKDLHFHSLADDPLVPDGYETAGTFTHTFLNKTIAGVVVLGSDPNHLLVLFQNGADAELFEFDGVDTLTLLESFAPPSGGEHRMAATFGDGHFTLMSASDAAGATDRMEIFTHDTPPYKPTGVYTLSPRFQGGGANVFLYSEEPFVGENAVRRYAGQAPDWSVNASLAGNALQATRLVDGGSGDGLDTPSTVNLVSWSEGGFALVNQWADDLSFYALDAVMGDQVAAAGVAPAGGYYEQAIQVRFSATPVNANVFYRVLPDGLWAVPVDSFWLAEDTDYQFFAQAPDGRKGPIQSVSYRFPHPDDMDSDRDGIPDYVEIARGVDPTAGYDSDGDGWSDLDEWRHGTSATSDEDFPETGSPRFMQQRLVDLLVTPAAHALIRDPDTDQILSVEPEPVYSAGLTIRLSTLEGALVASEVTQSAVDLDIPGVENPAALFTDIPVGFRYPWLTLSTPENFPVRGDAKNEVEANEQSGRQLLGVQLTPVLPPLDEPAYSHQGGNTLVEANGWIQTAIAHYQHLAPLRIDQTLDRFDTLAALLFERGLGLELFDRGVAESADITLFSFRAGDSVREAPSLEAISSLRTPGPQGEPARSPELFLQAVQAAVDAGAGKVGDLRTLTDEIYRISSRFGRTDPGSYPPPVDTLRSFIANGTLPPAYLLQMEMTETEVLSALSVVPQLLNLFTERPFIHHMRLVPSEVYPSGPGCSLFVDMGDAPWALLNERGRAFPLPLSLSLTPGMEFVVSGYSDVGSPCSPQALEVTSMVLASVTLASSNDQNGNLLPDSVERLLFGGSGGAHTADSDDDGYSDLQEILDGSDPLDHLSTPSGPVVDLSLPDIELKAEGAFQVEWDWPVEYQQYFEFVLEETNSLEEDFSRRPVLPQSTGDRMRMSVPDPGTETLKFYRLGISLR